MSGYRRPPSRAWLKKYPQRSSPRNRPTYTRTAVSRPYYASVARTRGAAVQEKKYFDANKALTAIPNTWVGSEMDPAINCLFAPGQGGDVTQRSGRKATMLALRMRGAIYCAPQINQTATETPTVVRVIVYQDTQTNKAQSQGEEVMDTTGGIWGFQNPANFGRFKVWKDKIFRIDNTPITYDGTDIEQCGAMRNFKFNLKFKKPIVVNFHSSSNEDVADIVDNSFHIIACTYSTGFAPQIVYSTRTVFLE